MANESTKADVYQQVFAGGTPVHCGKLENETIQPCRLKSTRNPPRGPSVRLPARQPTSHSRRPWTMGTRARRTFSGVSISPRHVGMRPWHNPAQGARANDQKGRTARGPAQRTAKDKLCALTGAALGVPRRTFLVSEHARWINVRWVDH